MSGSGQSPHGNRFRPNDSYSSSTLMEDRKDIPEDWKSIKVVKGMRVEPDFVRVVPDNFHLLSRRWRVGDER